MQTAAANEASNYVYDALEQLDYVVISSNRVVDALPRSPWRYPVQIRYYDLLRDGSLGFELAAEFDRRRRSVPSASTIARPTSPSSTTTTPAS